MLFVGKPLTLFVIAIFTYIIFTWRYRSPVISLSEIYDSNGFRTYVPAKAHTARPSPELNDGSSISAGLMTASSSSVAVKVDATSVAATSHKPSKTYTASSDLPMATLDPERMDEYMNDMLHWNRPGHVDGHWPDYEAFEGAEYDPNRWEGFEMDSKFYETGNGKFTPAQSSAMGPYLPYPAYDTDDWRSKWHGDFKVCDGPRGEPLQDNQLESLRAYPLRPQGFPEPFTGSADALGMDNDVCFDRVTRYGAYGYDASSKTPVSLVDWAGVQWGQMQANCFKRNEDRFKPSARVEWNMTPDFDKPEGRSWTSFHEEARREEDAEKGVGLKQYRSRTAVLIRTWEGYKYSSNDILTLRVMVSELSLRTGGEYQVFLFVNIKNYDEPIFTDPHAYRRMLIKNVPRELRDIAVLWNEKVCKQMYPEVTDWQVYWHQFMSVQWFSQQHPEYDYIWNWEMDVRYIGNHFHFLEKIQDFAREQPRKYLWERNARYYIPAFHGKSYDTYVKDTNAIIANSSAAGLIPKPVWGPLPYKDSQNPSGPKPPRPIEEDNFEWGVNEEADLITLLPIWDPTNTSWTMRNKIWNFNEGVHPIFNDEHPTDDEFFDPKEREIPRRAFINTVLRLSKKMLDSMHAENLAGRTMQAEMWPTTVALHHGLKAVYAPHPIYSAVKWPARYADAIFNADNGIPGRWGQSGDSVYNQDREVNFRPFSWYYHARFPRILYRRWMGWVAEDGLGDLGGPEWEAEEGEGRMCLPPMLLHPVKRDDLEDEA